MGWDEIRHLLAQANTWMGKQTFSDIEVDKIVTTNGIADATLSGTPRVFVIYDGETPYYFKAYPTKE